MARLLLLCLVAGCTSSFAIRFECRGDSTPATDSVSLVRCATLDSLASDSTGTKP